MHYKCPDCDCINDSEAWNKSTTYAYGGQIELIQDCEEGRSSTHFICPNCGNNLFFTEIIVLKDKKEIIKNKMLDLINC